MVLTRKDLNAPKTIQEIYSAIKLEKDPKDATKNPVISKIEQKLKDVCKFSPPTNPFARAIRGKTGPFHKTCSAKMYSNGNPIIISIEGQYENPGAIFTGGVDLTFNYKEHTSTEDITKIRDAITAAGLTEKT